MEGSLAGKTERKRTVARLVSAAAALLLAAALLAGCGSSKTDDFKSDFKPINDRLLSLGNSVGSAVGSAANKPDLVLAGQFTEFAAQLRSIRGRVDNLDPPDDDKTKVRTLSTALDRLTSDLREIANAARDHNAKAARAATVALVRDSQSAGDARRALARATGARVGP
jgi:outer membrane murein-binding lipoprotein Lpp